MPRLQGGAVVTDPQCQFVPAGEIEECGRPGTRTQEVIDPSGRTFRVWLCDDPHPGGNIVQGSAELQSFEEIG